jgi:hypothetical protein
MNYPKNILWWLLAFLVPLAIARADTLFVANRANGTISAIDSTGAITTYASGVSGANGLAQDAEGNLYVLDLEHRHYCYRQRLELSASVGFQHARRIIHWQQRWHTAGHKSLRHAHPSSGWNQ